MDKCKHEKVYANYFLTPTGIQWICRFCGEEGVDENPFFPITFANEYDAIKRKFEKKD